MTTLHTVSFQKTVLATLIGLCLNQSVFALQELSDDGLSETTGEGIAILPQDFSLRLNGADIANSGQGTYGAGYIRMLPVGPLSSAQEAKNYQKADMYLYGLSLAQSKKDYGVGRTATDWGVPFGAIAAGTSANATDFGRKITSWGTADNPWVIKTLNDLSVPNFNGALNNVTYLTLEAPLYKTGTIAATDADYNLKLGFWADAFMRDKTLADTGTYNTNELKNRLRLGFVWDGFGINGSNVKIFQTLNGVSSANNNVGGTYTANLKINGVPNQPRTFNYGMSTSYNNTFGIAGLVRLNSGPTDTTRGTVSNQTVTREIKVVNWNPTYTAVAGQSGIRGGTYTEGATLVSKPGTISGGTDTAIVTAAEAANAHSTAGITVTYRPPTRSGKWYLTDTGNPHNDPYEPFWYPSNPASPGGFFNSGICTYKKGQNVDSADNHCLVSEGYTTRRFKAYGTNSWTPPAFKSVLRISTQELTGGTFDNSTPALGGVVPNFAPNSYAAPNDRGDGIFLYDPNINLVLGNLYQPLMFSTDGNNFSIELARIPNKQEVYRRIYTRYEYIDPSSGVGAVDSGVSYLGSTCNIYTCGTESGGYQGSTATHSSITIGATNKINSATINGKAYTNLNWLTADTSSGSYGVSIGELKAGANIAYSEQADYTQVWNVTRTANDVTNYKTANSGCGFLSLGACYEDVFNAFSNSWQPVAPKAAITGQGHPSLNRADPYETKYRQNYNNQIMGIQTTMPGADLRSTNATNANQAIANTLNNMKPTGGTVSNNFGSVAIDGMLIQHLKFSTTGL
ncbi:hypothetical protein [Acinetobacter modestus]|uniref:hypothetical protein n=1 Tax=Acinetobacter modestus TaxID=1776740 RepID=UPI00301A05F2